MPKLGILPATGYLADLLQAWTSQLSSRLSHAGAASSGLLSFLPFLGFEVPFADHVHVSLQCTLTLVLDS